MRRESGKGGGFETFGQTESPLAWASGLGVRYSMIHPSRMGCRGTSSLIRPSLCWA
jgi:hypothetical protein